MKEAGIDPESMKDYVDGFRWGCPPVSNRSRVRERSAFR